MSRQGYVYGLHFCLETDEVVVLRFKSLAQREDMVQHVESVVACSPYHPVVANAINCHAQDPQAWPWSPQADSIGKEYETMTGVCAWGPVQS